MLAAQQKQKRYYDQHHLNVKHDVGSQVLLSRKHPTLKVLSIGSNKLMSNGLVVLKRIDPLTYCLEVPESMKVNSVWHVSYLKAYKSDDRPPPPLLDMSGGELEIEVERILNHRTRTWDGRMLTDLCCKCLQLRNKTWMYCEANSCSHYLTLQPHCLPDLLQPGHHLWFTQRECVQPLARQ